MLTFKSVILFVAIANVVQYAYLAIPEILSCVKCFALQWQMDLLKNRDHSCFQKVRKLPVLVDRDNVEHVQVRSLVDHGLVEALDVQFHSQVDIGLVEVLDVQICSLVDHSLVEV